MDDQQSAWDDEDAAAFKQRLRKATAAIKEADAELCKQRLAFRAAKRVYGESQSALNGIIGSDIRMSAKNLLMRLRELDQAVQSAEEGVRCCRQLCCAARARKRLAMQERSAMIRAKFERFPLEEYAARQQGGKS